MRMYRIGIVGASSLVGKELSDELGESLLGASDFVLLDEDEAAGQMTATGDEAAFIQRLEASSFDRMDFVFFAGECRGDEEALAGCAAGRSQHRRSDLCAGGREGCSGAGSVGGGGAGSEDAAGGREPDLNTPAVVAAHPAAVMLALVAARLQAKLPLTSVAATVMEPASEDGRLAMDELHQQTVNLLSFQTLPREQYDAQVAFNLLPSLGEAAKVKLAVTEKRIREQYAELSGGVLPPLALQMVQAPVFHGYVVSMLVEVGAGRDGGAGGSCAGGRACGCGERGV